MNLEELKKVNGIYEIQKLDPVTFIHGDNMEFLRWCERNTMYKYFHVGIVDPPYGVGIGDQKLGRRSGDKVNYETGSWDNEIPTQEYWDLLRYVCRELIVWGGNYFTKEFDWSGRCFGIWDKKNDNLDFAFGELILTTFDKNPFKILKARNSRVEDGDKRHPTQKPVYCYEYLHLNYVDRNQRVLDTHGGSFSHAVAARNCKHELVIMDKTKSYYDDGIIHYKKELSRVPEKLF